MATSLLVGLQRLLLQDQVQAGDYAKSVSIIHPVASLQRAHTLERRGHRRLRALHNPLPHVDDVSVVVELRELT